MAYIMKKTSLVSIEEAQEMIITGIRPLEGETVPLLETQGRILSDDIISDVMVPNVADSAMDGYAVIAEDIEGASRKGL
jgi:molybdopterin molybdotransferase